MSDTGDTEIRYTFGADAPAALRGRTFTGGTVATLDGQRVIRFRERVDGKRICARIAGRPELEQAAAEYEAERAAEERARVEEEKAKREEIARNVPGLGVLKAAEYAAEADRDRYHTARERMMESEDGCCHPPRRPDPAIFARRDEIRKLYPRAAEWYRCEWIIAHTHWADNTGRARDARKRQEALERGEA